MNTSKFRLLFFFFIFFFNIYPKQNLNVEILFPLHFKSMKGNSPQSDSHFSAFTPKHLHAFYLALLLLHTRPTSYSHPRPALPAVRGQHCSPRCRCPLAALPWPCHALLPRYDPPPFLSEDGWRSSLHLACFLCPNGVAFRKTIGAFMWREHGYAPGS